MSVKRKFRKSKKTKGKTKDNNKHKNNEKRSKIQRKTKKRVLSGGWDNGTAGYGNYATGSVSIQQQSTKVLPSQCKKNDKRTEVHSTRNKLARVMGRRKVSADQCNQLKKEIYAFTNTNQYCLSPNASQDVESCSEININVLPEMETEIEPEAPVPSNAGVQYNQEIAITDDSEAVAEAEAAEEKKSQKIHEAEYQVEEDSKVQTDEMSDSTQTLALSDQHKQLADKYKNLEEKEQDPDIKEIYSKAFLHHNLVSSRLYAIWDEQKKAEQKEANTSQVEGALQPPTPNVEVHSPESGADADVSKKTDAELDAINAEKLYEAIEKVKTRGNINIEQTDANPAAINEAVDKITLRLSIPTKKIENNSDETLLLAKQHCDLVVDYESLVNTEQNSDVKQMYIVAKDYHTFFCEKLQDDAELQKLEALEALEAQTQALAEPEKVDELNLFPSECFGKYSICKKKLNELENQSYFCYQFLKHMKIFLIKKSTLIDFDSDLSSENVPTFSASANFIDRYLNFFEFYNEHMADGDDTKKFVVERNGNIVMVLQDVKSKEKYISMKQYPKITLKTFFDNCNKLYDLSLPQVCNFRLAELAYNEQKFGEEFNVSMTTQEIAESLNNFTPTIFTPTSIEESNLQKIIKLLSLCRNGYIDLANKPEYQTNSSYLKKYNSILPPSPYFSESILPVIRDTSEHSLLDFIDFIVKYQLIYPRYSVICVTSLFGISRDTTRADIREGVQSILEPYGQQIIEIVDSGDIFKSTCPFIAENPDIKTKIIALIKANNQKITHPSWDDFPSGSEKNCSAKSESFVRELEDETSDFKTNIFFHMIIFACYNTMVNENQWGIKGTTLMILFMNIFIINFFNNILDQVNRFCLSFFNNAIQNQVSVILIDENVSTFLEYIENLKPFFLGLEITKKTGKTFHLEEEFTIHLYDEFKRIQGMIKKKNDEQVKFIEGLCESYSQESTESVKSKKKTKFEEMHQKNLRVKMIKLCEELKTKVEEKYDVKHPGEREKWQSQQPVLAVTSDMSVDFNPTILNKTDLTKIKDECKEFVVNLISVARAIKANMYFDEKGNNISVKPIFYDKKQLNQLNRCCDPRDIFSKGENSREHNKRIARAFYGLSEIWPYIDQKQISAILLLPGVRNLIHKFNTDESFRKLVQNQCNDDGKRESKLLGRIWRSKNREDIIANINPNDLSTICEADINESPLKDLINLEPVVVQDQAEIQQEIQETPEEIVARQQIEESIKRAEEEFAKDLEEAAANIAKNSAKAFELTPTDIEHNLISDAQGNLETIDGKKNVTGEFSIPIAIESIENFKKEHPLLYIIALTRHKLKIPRNRKIAVGELARRFVESRKVINQRIEEKTYEPPISLIGKFKRFVGIKSGGTTLTKTKHKSNHKAKAKTQSKPKHKNKSKPKSKPKHRTKSKSKTIKKNKRAHHKFDKKYTRKR
jgi:hypothetical protein